MNYFRIESNIIMDEIIDTIWSYYNQMIRNAWKIVKDDELARDMASEAVTRVLERIYSDNPPHFVDNNPIPYLNRVLVNISITAHRRNAITSVMEQISEDRTPSSYYSIETDKYDVYEIMQKSPGWVRDAINAKMYSECSKTAAASLNINEATFKVRLHRARKFIKNKYGVQ